MLIIEDEIIAQMVKMGFTVYEAKTYLALLKSNPATGYEVSQIAHIPRSVIYSVLRKLESEGVVISIHDKPKKYIPLSPKQFLSKMEFEFSAKLSELKKKLLKFNNKPETEGFWNLRGYQVLIQTCESLIKEASSSVYISGWKREIEHLKDALLSARKRGVDVIIFSFNDIDKNLGEVFCYGIDENKLSKMWGHKLIVVVDSKELVMGPSNMTDYEQAIWTQNRAVLTIAVNYIILDITLYGQRFGVDVSKTVSRMMPERVNSLEDLIKESVSSKHKS
ncbi:MAG: TrmB family transcriptional regulator [Candidatus Marinimicrobia bacterium]|nr:TrmB family transcriptional regulator [Candidatus Neomarinimicrobiota bacterium]